MAARRQAGLSMGQGFLSHCLPAEKSPTAQCHGLALRELPTSLRTSPARAAGSTSSPSAGSAAEQPKAATSECAGVKSLSHLCPCQVRGAALAHTPRLGPGVPQSRLEAEDGAGLRCASGRATCPERGCSSAWVACAQPQSGLASRVGPGGTLPAEWQPMPPRGCAVAGKWCHFPQVGLWGTGVPQKATIYWGTSSWWDPETFVAVCFCSQSATGRWGTAQATCGTHKAEVLT